MCVSPWYPCVVSVAREGSPPGRARTASGRGRRRRGGRLDLGTCARRNKTRGGGGAGTEERGGRRRVDDEEERETRTRWDARGFEPRGMVRVCVLVSRARASGSFPPATVRRARLGGSRSPHRGDERGDGSRAAHDRARTRARRGRPRRRGRQGLFREDEPRVDGCVDWTARGGEPESSRLAAPSEICARSGGSLRVLRVIVQRAGRRGRASRARANRRGRRDCPTSSWSSASCGAKCGRGGRRHDETTTFSRASGVGRARIFAARVI